MKIPNRKFSVRKTIAAAVTSTALVAAGLAGAGEAAAAPTGDALIAQQALEGIEPSPQDAADVIGGIEAANKLLNELGITPFTPTIGACTDFSFPLALGGAVPGPATPGWPASIPLPDSLAAIESGEILYGFVPVGAFNDSGAKSGMQVAWLNINTFEGGLSEPMDGLAETILGAALKRADDLPGSAALKVLINTTLGPVLNALPSNGVRGGLVETGEGTVLSAIYGSVQKGDATCYFFPSLGIAVAGGSDAGDSDSDD